MPINHGYYHTIPQEGPGNGPEGSPSAYVRRRTAEPFGEPGIDWELLARSPGLRRRRKRWPFIAFGCLILLMVALTIALSLLLRDAPSSLERYPLPTFQNAPQATKAPTTVERAPVGGGVTLSLTPVGDRSALSFQEIYRKNQNAIISVRGSSVDSVALGTGVMMTSDGYLITNAHVIEGCAAVDITLSDDTTHSALLVGFDTVSDLAVLKIDAEHLDFAEFGDSNALQVGDTALAIGNPLGERFRGTMTSGIISAINRDVVVDGNKQALIQTTAALNSGNSGGALINDRGQVVGITSMKMTSNYDTIEGLGFAIPSATVKEVVDELIAAGHIGGRPTIGIVGATLNAQQAAKRGVPQGVQVVSVEPKSDAYAKGLKPGDVIVGANGQTVTSIEDLNRVKDKLGAGQVLSFSVYREGKHLTIDVMLVEQYSLHQ